MSIIVRKKAWNTAQVRKLWEVLLYAQPGWGEALRRQVVEGLVRARLVGGVTSTKRVAEGKRIFDIPNGFLMTKVRRLPRICPELPDHRSPDHRLSMDSQNAALAYQLPA